MTYRGISKKISSSDGQYRVFGGKLIVGKLIYSGNDDADGWIKMWDGPPASGTLLFQIYIEEDDDVGVYPKTLDLDMICRNGLYVEVNDSDISCTVLFDYI